VIPDSVRGSFFVAAQELGMWTASSLFLREVTRRAGAEAVDELRERLGREFPVFDAVAERCARGEPLTVDAEKPAAAVRGALRVLVVGFDADPLDALVDRLPPETHVGLIASVGELCGDLPRALANYRGRVEHVALASLPAWIGRRSALLTFVYGVDEHETAYTNPAWLRTQGPDVRTQFRSLVGWNLLGRSPAIHPRWVVATPADDFSDLVGP
jgi:hypothetical protein